MKKNVIVVLLTLVTVALMAQEGSQNLGFNLGFSDAVLRERASSGSDKLDRNTQLYGIKAGLVYETTFIKGFGMQLGLNYTFGTQLGKWAQQNDFTILKAKDNYYYHQIEIPVDWQYKFEIAKQTWLLLYTGPTIQAGLSMKKTTFKETPSGSVEQQGAPKEHYASDADNDGKRDYFRTNVTWGVGAGFQYKRYFLRGGYDFGVASPYRDKYFDPLSATSEGWNRKGRFDQWSLKLGIYFLQF